MRRFAHEQTLEFGTVSRRGVLLGAAGLLFARRSSAAAAIDPSPIRSIAQDEWGTTIALALPSAPFPAAGSPYQDDTVIAFVPHHFRYGRGEGVSVLVHFHGHRTTAPAALAAHAVREQLADSKQNAILLAPQGPVDATDSGIGKLEADHGLARMIDDSLRALSRKDIRATLGSAAVPPGAKLGTVCISAHSGGYHAAAAALTHGGVPITEVYLFDALYAEAETFRKWVVEGKGRRQRDRHKLISYFTGGATEYATRSLAHALAGDGVRCELELVEGSLSRAQITLAEFVGIRSGVGHEGVAVESNELRDCLLASAMPRHVRTAWFDEKDGARPLDHRR